MPLETLAQTAQLWFTKGYDQKNNNFFEALDPQGNPIANTPRRMRVQLRQCYSASRMANLLDQPHLGQLAQKVRNNLWKTCWNKTTNSKTNSKTNGGFCQTLDHNGMPNTDSVILYDQAFALLMEAQLLKNNLIDETGITKILDLLEKHLRSKNNRLGFIDETPEVKNQNRSQNPHMHLYEACLELLENKNLPAKIKSQTEAIAKEILELAQSHFLNQGMISESFLANWEPIRTPNEPANEPGHAAEWIFLLDKTTRVLDKRHYLENKPQQMQKELFDKLQLGQRKDGFLCDKITNNAQSSGARLWPQCEFLRALKIIEPNKAAAFWQKIHAAYFAISPTKGGWSDQPFNNTQAMQASSHYHIISALECLAEKTPYTPKP